MHVRGHFKRCDALMHHFPVVQEAGNNTDDFAASSQRRIRNRSHKTDMTAAVNQFDSILSQRFPEFGCTFGINRGVAKAGAAENSAGTDGHERQIL